ncbi:MAG: glycine cleavage system protein GcvH [Candidatus Limnocylindrales bacterium]|jgi:glycine cleavage system H protein
MTLEDSDVDIPETLRYSEDHEWLRTEGGEGVIGITAYAADELGDVVFVELPQIGRTLARGEVFGVIESVKTASDLFAPVAGEVIAVNEALGDDPELVNSEPYGGGWMVRLRLDDAAAAEELMDAAAYGESIGG